MGGPPVVNDILARRSMNHEPQESCVPPARAILNSLVVVGGAALLPVFLSLAIVAQTDQRLALKDDSDWWSDSRVRDAGYSVKTQERVPPDTTYQIAGIELSDDVFSDAAAKLGKVALVERDSESSYRRTQACYVSDDRSGRAFLIFETGDFPVSPSFYLFLDGAEWKGSELCRRSRLVSRSLATGSGLHLGQTPAQVIAILGKPSRQRGNELIYGFHAHRQKSAEELKKLRQSNPQLSDEDFHDWFAVYDLESGVHARFVDSKLTYLGVSKAEIH